ncbi:FIST C-terminal domain-containing protein [Lutimonas halocynthiae]|uniref:FIST signal transduction protein n=1 Tax=Lutimonas halocynthiae TaxID=1446477 RepID=UPI0025B56EAB|nr:FIST N-terminal domain-containing protein [Lutimonas halocynthiae]MDN3642957.1 FIST C-terminal domain-containing protein [Lutimonas halocynthiae]
MKTALYKVYDNSWEKDPKSQDVNDENVNLVLCFASKFNLSDENIYKNFKAKFPAAEIAMASTAGEICQESVLDNSVVVVAMEFDKTVIRSTTVNIKDYKNSYEAAISLGKKLPKNDLSYILVFSDGSLVNGSELVKGLSTQVAKNILITGGLAGDDANFESTLVGLNKQPIEGEIMAIGFYGNSLTVTHGSQGGWDIFGLQKRVTNSASNVLLELEDQNALDLYKKYLGEESKKLPGSALLFPLSVTIPGATEPIVRTILSINEEDKSMTFAGDVPVGSEVRFMKANFDKIIQAASNAADQTIIERRDEPDFALLISCVGRKLILDTKIEEEIKSVSKSFDHKTIMAGFYSYGEISPVVSGGKCQLHNQTMTITSFYED